MTRVLIADDEPHLRRRLRELLEELWPDHGPGHLELGDEVADGDAALAKVREFHPEVVFLDIRMPGPSGIEVARRLCAEEHAPQVVFVTAYDDHAVEAFEAAAVDYLLKPVERRRLISCLERLQGALRDRTAEARLATVLDRLEEIGQGRKLAAPLRWLRAGMGDETELVAVDDVVYFRAEHKYVTAVTSRGKHLLRVSLKELMERLDADRFWRIHRALVVNVGQVRRARKDLRGCYVLTLRDRKEQLRTSRAYAHLFRSM